MNKHDVKDWKNSPVTKAVLDNIAEAVSLTREQSNIRDTADQTAMQAARNEGFCEGVQSLLDSIEELDLIGDDNDE